LIDIHIKILDEYDLRDECELTDDGKQLLQEFRKEYLKAWKAGNNEAKSTRIALKKVNLNIGNINLLQALEEYDS